MAHGNAQARVGLGDGQKVDDLFISETEGTTLEGLISALAGAAVFEEAPVEVDPESETLAEDLFDALVLLGLVVAPPEE